MDYQLIAVGAESILDTLEFGHWVPLDEAIETIKGFYPDVLGIIRHADQAIVWRNK
jgi:hypothetical protein